jgi:hypothetical protein
MKYLLIILVALVVLDGVLTRFLIDGELAREGNPLLRGLVGENIFIAIKTAGALFCAFLLRDVYKRFPRVAMATAGCGVVAYSGIVLWNTSFFIMA